MRRFHFSEELQNFVIIVAIAIDICSTKSVINEVYDQNNTSPEEETTTTSSEISVSSHATTPYQNLVSTIKTASTASSDEISSFTDGLSESKKKAIEVTGILANILNGYDKKARPNMKGAAEEIKVGLQILRIGSISEKTMEFSLHCYFRQYWIDKRLSFPAITNHTSLPLNAEKVLEQIWHPDTYIRNGKKSFIHKLTVPNIFLRLSSDGSVLLSQRLTINSRCVMRLSKFPLDRQECPLEIGSLGYNVDEMQYLWTDIGIEVDLDQELSQFKLIKVITQSNLTVKYNEGETKQSILLAHFHLVRQTGYYILQIYLPTSMIVAMSWVSFWINQEAAIARCSLGVTTVLTLTTLRLGVKEELPVVHYSTALDVFLFVAFGFVCGALVEFVIIHSAYLSLLRKMLNETKKIRSKTASRTTSFGLLDQKSPRTLSIEIGEKLAKGDRNSMAINRVHMSLNDRTSELDDDEDNNKYGDLVDSESIQYIDKYAKFMFPIFFFIFHVLYWLIFMYYLDDRGSN